MGKYLNDGELQIIKQAAAGIRRRVLEHTLANNGGYLSQACSAAEIIAALYLKIMKLGPSIAPMIPSPFGGVPSPHNINYLSGAGYNGPSLPELDRFVLSPSQYALVIYAALVELGRMAPEGLSLFNQDGGTVEMIGAEHSPGMEVMSGSLGQGISQAAGIAMGRKLKCEQGRVWVFMSDGEFQPGQTWEAIQTMVYHRLDNIGVYVDINGQQCDGTVDQVMTMDPLDKKLRYFGARVYRVNGHDIEALIKPALLKPNGRPLIILADTNPCQGMDILQKRAPKLHYIRFEQEADRLQLKSWYESQMSGEVI